MKTASTLIQIIALSACLAVHVSASGEFEMAGMRRAIQTMAQSQVSITVEAPAAEGASFAA